jgi:hypothetical protein
MNNWMQFLIAGMVVLSGMGILLVPIYVSFKKLENDR